MDSKKKIWVEKPSNGSPVYVTHLSSSTSGVHCTGSGFEVPSGRIIRIFWIWIGYRFRFNRIRNQIIQIKNCDNSKKTDIFLVVSGKSIIFRNQQQSFF